MACVSDESMATWMDYIHMQMPIDGIYHNATITGVPVSLDGVDPNGNYIHIGDTTSDMSGTLRLCLGSQTMLVNTLLLQLSWAAMLMVHLTVRQQSV